MVPDLIQDYQFYNKKIKKNYLKILGYKFLIKLGLYNFVKNLLSRTKEL
jgi:hypothetical protein